MRIRPERKMMPETAWYILDSQGWTLVEGMNGDESIISKRADDGGVKAEYNRFTHEIYINTEMKDQELLAILTIFNIL